MAIIEISNVYKIFGRHPDRALEQVRDGMSKPDLLARTGHTLGLGGIDLEIREGEVFVIMGLSGSGKSTLIRHINRLVDPTAGEIRFDGADILKFSAEELRAFRRREVAMVFQRFGLLPHRTVMDNVALGPELQGVSRARRCTRAETWIERVGLSGYETHYPDQLSGGMQQRVGLARALCTDPRVLLMDEPFGALDPLIRTGMQDELIALHGALDKTIVFITHDFAEALRLADRIAVLDDGIICQTGTPDELVKAPANDVVRAFVKNVKSGT